MNLFARMWNLDCVPGFVQGARDSKTGLGLCPLEEFLVLGEGDARFEPSSLTSSCSLHLYY